jgi:amino acid transporter
MFSNQKKSRLCFISVAVLLLGSAYCLLWVLSSASLACAACNCDYALFAEQVRCRQPYIAAALSVALLFASIFLALLGRKYSAQHRAGDA